MILARALDALILIFTAIWLAGGVPWQGKLLLKHGADPRRAALLLTLVALAVAATRSKSLVARAARWAFDRLHEARWRRGLLLAAFAWAALVGVLQTLALRVPLYDVGIFHQILWSIAHGLGFHSTVSGAGNFLLDHFSPSLALLAPFYWLGWSSALLPAVLHSALIWIGVGAWVRLAEHAPGASPAERARLAACVTLFAVGFDSLWGNLRWGLHESSIAFATLSWALALMFDEGTWRWRRPAIVLLLLVTALTKEILLVDMAIAFGVFAWKERDPRLAIPSVFLLAGFVWFESLPHPADKNYFARYYAYLGNGLGEFFVTLLTRPWKVVEAVGAGELLRYAKTVALPWLALPLVLLGLRDMPRASKVGLAILLPSLASAAIATYPPLRGPGFHYVLELWPVLATLTILALARLRRPRLALAWSLLALVLLDQDPWGQAREYFAEARERAPVVARFRELPPEVPVIADELAGPWVASRQFITRWPTTLLLPEECPRWIFLRAGQLDVVPGGISRCGHVHERWREPDWIGYELLPRR